MDILRVCPEPLFEGVVKQVLPRHPKKTGGKDWAGGGGGLAQFTSHGACSPQSGIHSDSVEVQRFWGPSAHNRRSARLFTGFCQSRATVLHLASPQSDPLRTPRTIRRLLGLFLVASRWPVEHSWSFPQPLSLWTHGPPDSHITTHSLYSILQVLRSFFCNAGAKIIIFPKLCT